MGTFLMICGVIIGFIPLFCIVLHLSSRGLRKAVIKFTTALKNREFDIAYSMLAHDFKKQVNRQNFEEFLAQCEIYNIKEVQSYSGDYSISVGRGTVSPFIIREDNKFFKLDINMVKINKNWLVNSLDITTRIAPLEVPTCSDETSML